MKNLLLAIGVLLLTVTSAKADDILSVKIPTKQLDMGDTAALSFTWDATDDVISGIDLVFDGNPFVVVSSSAIFTSTGGLVLLGLANSEGDAFQIDQSIFVAPPILPTPGTYEAALSIICFTASSCPLGELPAGYTESGETLATVTATPEPGTLSLMLTGLGLLGLLVVTRKRVALRQPQAT